MFNKAPFRRQNFQEPNLILSCKDGAVESAVTFHQCNPGSIPGVDAICWAHRFTCRLSLLLLSRSLGSSRIGRWTNECVTSPKSDLVGGG